MRRALLSVTDKTGLVPFASGLASLGFELVSTGGTAAALRREGLAVTDVADVTGFPEMLDGRVKTLHPAVHGGILADLRRAEHRAQLESGGIRPFDIVCVNLYAFEQTVTVPHTLEEAVESIDIGGPAMVRAAAKNWANVAIVVDPADYEVVLLEARDRLSDALRLTLAAKAFRHTAYYDSMVGRYLTQAAGEEPLQERLTIGFRRSQKLRYGENPHQTASVYVDPLTPGGVPQARQLWGKELSYNNILDADAAWELVCDLPEGSCAIIKHGNPCGAASCDTIAESFRAAKASDPVSAFGGIAAVSGTVGLAEAEALCEKGNFLEVVIARAFDVGAVDLFKDRSGWGQDVRLLEAAVSPSQTYLSIRSVRGGAVVQGSDEPPDREWQIVTHRQPTESEWRRMKYAWALVPHVKSNAIVLAGEDRLLGVGAGQMNRVQSVRIALEQAGEGSSRAALASDAFFPFPDSIESAASGQVTAVVQPGGSKKDADVIARADELGVTMAFTGTRHFRH